MPCAAGIAVADSNIELKRLEHFISGHRIGSFDDFWLAKKLWPEEIVKLGLIFGYVDNRAACQELAELLGARYQSAEYVCYRANHKLKPRPDG